ncbi:hypothetical protein MRB53_039573 [Persea americana]|nr:hypothetical protein MRB53_039573 [Persea americana]
MAIHSRSALSGTVLSTSDACDAKRLDVKLTVPQDLLTKRLLNPIHIGRMLGAKSSLFANLTCCMFKKEYWSRGHKNRSEDGADDDDFDLIASEMPLNL